MKTLNKVSLKKYTTIKIGGESSKIYFPETLEDFDHLKSEISLKKTVILGNGSNIAFKDSGYKNSIISLKDFNFCSSPYGYVSNSFLTCFNTVF